MKCDAFHHRACIEATTSAMSGGRGADPLSPEECDGVAGANPVRMVFLSVGTSGDILPFASLAESFANRGRDVLFIAHIDSKAQLAPFRFPQKFFGVPGGLKWKLADPRITHPVKGFRVLFDGYGESLVHACRAIIGSVGRGPAQLIAHPFSVPAAVMARELGVVQSVAAGYLAPSMLRTLHGPLALGTVSIPAWMPRAAKRAILKTMDWFFVDPVAAFQTNLARQSLGLAPIRSYLPHVAESPDLSLTLFPRWFAASQPDWPSPLVEGGFQFVAATSAQTSLGELHHFLASGDAPILFMPGSSNRHARAFFRIASQVVQARGQRAIFLTPYPEQLPHPLPESIHWISFVELGALLGHVRAVVHHGGIGTVAQALRSGVPQVVVPFAWDQFDNANRVVDLAGGVMVRATDLTPTRLRECLHRIEASVKIRQRSASFKGFFVKPVDEGAFSAAIDKALASC